MTPNAYESWAVSSAMLGRFDGIDRSRLRTTVHRLIDCLKMSNVCRTSIVQGWIVAQDDDRAALAAIADADPDRPPCRRHAEPPGPEAVERFPTPSITGIASEAQS